MNRNVRHEKRGCSAFVGLRGMGRFPNKLGVAMSSNLPIDLAEDASSFSAALLHVRYWHLADIG